MSEEREKSFEGREEEEKADGDTRSPGEPVPQAAIHHGDGGISGVKEDGHGSPEGDARTRALPLLEFYETISSVEGDDWHVGGMGKGGRRVLADASYKPHRNKCDDCSLGVDASAKEVEMVFAGGMGKAEEEKGDNQLREKREAEEFPPIGENPSDLLLRERHGGASRGDLEDLLAGEALEVGHLAFHLFASGVGGRTNALDAELEFVGVGRAHESFFEGDELLTVEIEEGLIEGLHAVLAAARGDSVVNEAGFVGVDDAIANVGSGDHDFASGDAALVVSAANEALGDDSLEGGGHLQTNLFLLGRRKDGDDALNGFGSVEGVQGGENQVAGLGGQEGGGNGFEVAHFADEDDVGVLTKSGAESGGEVSGVHFDFALVDEAALVAVQKLDGVLDGDEVVGAVGVDAVNHGGKRGGLTGTGGAGDKDKAALLFANFSDDTGEIELFDGANLRGNDAENHADVAALLKNVDAEAAKAGDAVSHVEFSSLLEFLFLPVGHHAEGHGEHFFGRDAGNVGDGGEQTVHAKVGMVADFQVQVGSFIFDSAPKEIVNANAHVSVVSARKRLRSDSNTRHEEQQEKRANGLRGSHLPFRTAGKAGPGGGAGGERANGRQADFFRNKES